KEGDLTPDCGVFQSNVRHENMDFRLKISKLQLKIPNNGVKITKARQKMSVIRLKIMAFCNGNYV
ncbi:MAG: hypothetical protein FWH27_12810, partial [Planctomycetaceae bacterium]|nr:hypothetical protein [Planctomycetaceae bacterium]